MPVTVIVGAQFGGEGKGKITAYLAKHEQADMVVRCGGPNSGHTFTYRGQNRIVRQIPAALESNSKLSIAAGAIIDLQVLEDEIKTYGLSPRRLRIDKHAVVISGDDRESEKTMALRSRFGSTSTGTGAAVARRAIRHAKLQRAEDVAFLEGYVDDVSAIANEMIDADKLVMIEGTQGYGLSVYHSPHFPYVTSRDTTAAAFASEVGVSPLSITDVVLVARTFPIRVAGNSGPLLAETSWETISTDSGYGRFVEELSSVTKTRRRVAKFTPDLVRKAIAANRPTIVALNGLDYVDAANLEAKRPEDLTAKARDFIREFETLCNVRVSLVGVGPTDDELIDLPAQKDSIQAALARGGIVS